MNALLREELSEVNNILLDIYTGEVEEEQLKERFKITNLESANWAFRKLKAIEEKEAEIKDLIEKEIKRIQEWAKHDLDKCNDSKQFFEFLLEDYFRKQKELDPKFKVSTPYGKVSSRKQQPKWNYEEDIIIESLKENNLDSLIKIKEEVKKADIKKEAEIIEDVFVFDNEVVCRTTYLDTDGVEFVNIETGEIYDWNFKTIEHFDQLVIYDGKIINGIKVEPQPDSITIKVEA